MPTNDERREVAARLRSLKFTFEDDFEDELSAFYDALECNLGQKRWEINPYWFLADLIEPEPERTCRPKEWLSFLSGTDCPAWECSECGELFEAYANYCSNCGAKVVSECE
jgi:hypothetical protein